MNVCIIILFLNRKFADIEAANHQLASALYFKDEEKNLSSLSSQKPEADGSTHSVQLQDPEERSINSDTDGNSQCTTDILTDQHQRSSEQKHADSQHLWKRHPKSHPTPRSTRKKTQSKGRKEKSSAHHKVVEFTSMSSPIGPDYHQETQLLDAKYFDDESPLKSVSILSEDPQTTQHSDLIQSGQGVDVSPPFSPELSPLSLDSCDFSIQMFTDMSTCSQAQRTIADIAESPWTDIMDLFSVDSKDLGGCTDTEAYFENICARQSDGGQEVNADILMFAEQSDCFTERMHKNRSELHDLHCDRGVYGYEYGYSCHGDQGLGFAETQFDNFKPTPNPDIGHTQLPTSACCHYSSSQLQSHQPAEVSPCLVVNCEKILSFTPFEGVAQSFSAPLHNPEHRLIPTPPHEDDWLFTDILKDRKSHEC